MDRVCVYCGSRPGTDSAHVAAAERVGRALADRDVGVVYGGASVGVMGALADAALAAGGEVYGVIPEALLAYEVAHDGLTELLVVESMHERKRRMVELSDAFLALPGGFGTLEELMEVLTWAQLGLHECPCGVLNVEDYYDGLVSFFDHATAEGFVDAEHREMVVVGEGVDDVEDVLEAFERYDPPPQKSVLEDDET